MPSEVLVQRCADCDHFIPVDVFKGLCHINKRTVLADDPSCNECAPMKKCKFCRHYLAKDEYLGLCKTQEPTYPDLVARTCEMFEWCSSLQDDLKQVVVH